MTLLLGKDSLLNKMSLKYFTELDARRQHNASLQTLVEMVSKKDSYFMSVEDCLLSYKNTYQSPTKPFGLICQKSCNGKIETSAENIYLFNSQLKLAIDLIREVGIYDELLKNLLKCVLPLGEISENPCLRKDGSGFSAHWLKGAVFLSLPQRHPYTHLELAINLVHELGHQSLMLYQDADAIISPEDFNKPIYSAIRKTFRPSIMSLHALVAIYFMYYFVSEVSKADTALTQDEKHFFMQKKNRFMADFATGCFGLKGVNFTSVGAELLLEMIEYFQQSRAA